MKFIFFIAMIIAGYSTKAQTIPGLTAYSTKQVDVFSFTYNQASLAQLKNNAAGFYGERKFMLSELNNYTAVASLITNSGNFGLKATYSGFTDYNESQLGFAYGRKLGSKIDIGAQFNYNSIRINSYGNTAAISFELGTILHLTDKLNAGIHASNPIGGKFGKEEQEKLPSVYTIGLGYDASEKFFISVEIEKEENQPINVNGGIQYNPVPKLLVRGGISSTTSSTYLGVGLLLKSFRLDIYSSYHPQLGITPGILLLFNLQTKK